MRLKYFKAVDCFGFGEDAILTLDSMGSLYTILGRNSSGKSSLLDAIKSLEFDSEKPPNKFKRFKNFSCKIEGYLEAGFEVEKDELDANEIVDYLRDKLFKTLQLDPQAFEQDTRFQELFTLIKEQYNELISSYKDEITVRKMHNGNYLFSNKQDEFESAKQRIAEISSKINNIYLDHGGQKVTNIGANRRIGLNFSAEELENILFKQFPIITYFDKENSLIADFPDRFTLETVSGDTYAGNDLVQNFLRFLEKEDVIKFLEEEDPSKKDALLESLRIRAKTLEDRINEDITDKDLIKIILSSNNGLQVTFAVDDKPGYYYLLSENTQLLFGYHLFSLVYEFDGDIILLDEPNQGFHASVQNALRDLLMKLAKENTVIFTTHSEYMINPDDLSGIKLMSKDEQNRLYIRNDFHDQAKASGDYLALQPLMTSIGLQIGNNLNSKKEVIITEGITDMYYILVFNEVLGFNLDLNIAPARGDGTILSLIPLIIAQGISFKVISDINPHHNIPSKLEENFGIEDKYCYEVPVPQLFEHVEDSGIEDLFSSADFRKIVVAEYKTTDKEEDLFINDSNLHIIKQLGKGDPNLKRIIAFKLYLNKKNLSKNDFDQATLKNFEEILKFCQKNSWKKI